MRREYRWALLLLPVVLLLSTWYVQGQAKTEEAAIATEETGVANVAGGALPKDAETKAEPAAAKAADATATPIVEEKKADPAAEPAAPAKVEEAAKPEVKAVVEPAVDKIEEKPAEPAAAKIETAPAAEAPKPAAPAEKAEVVDAAVEDAFKEAAKEGIPPRPAAKAPVVVKPAEVKAEPVAAAPAAEPAPAPAPAAEVKAEPAAATPAVEAAAAKPADEAAKPVVEVAAPPAVEKKPVDPKTAEVMLVKEGEILRRDAYEKHASETLDEAEKALIQRRHPEAVKLFEEAVKALKQVSDRPENAKDRMRARKGLADAYYRYAAALKDQKDFERAKPMATQAYNNGHPKASELLVQIEQAKKEPPPPPMKPQPLAKSDEFKQKQKDVDQLLSEGRQYFSMQEYAKAQEKFGSVMRRDPENTEAMRYLSKIAQKKLDRATIELESTRQDMVSEVRKTWNPRNYGVNDQVFATTTVAGKQTENQTMKEKEEILQQLSSITIPEIEFRQANIYDVVDELQKNSLEFDPKKKGVNIILSLGAGRGPAPLPGDTNNVVNPGSDLPPVTFKARNVNLAQALKVVAEMAGLKYRIEGRMVKIVRLDAPDEELIQRMYDVVNEPRVPTLPPTAGGGPAAGGGPGLEAIATGGNASDADLKAKFQSFGVGWPTGSSISHVKEIGKMIVVNTPDNLARLEQILEVINIRPQQIEIEARFVEVNQNDLTSMGFEWMLTDSWKMLQKKGQESLPPNQRQMIVMPKNNFTKGERFLTSASTPRVGPSSSPVADNFLTFASVLTNPELAFVVHMLEQQGHSDLLSAPKVTTKAGQEASIRVVTEYIYPTAFTVQNGNPAVIGANGAVSSPATPPVVTPESFEKREVGVILSVTPTISEQGNMIDLTMAPQVVTEPEWKNYGSTYYDTAGNPLFQLPMEQPFFHLRTVVTSISIYNGATVVMGGMITEKRVTVDDKIPFLGDIPLIGRLFRSKHDESEKRNLLIFVTARLVDPAGREIKRNKPPPPLAPAAPRATP